MRNAYVHSIFTLLLIKQIVEKKFWGQHPDFGFRINLILDLLFLYFPFQFANIFFSSDDKDPEAYAIGLSEISRYLWDRAAKIP